MVMHYLPKFTAIVILFAALLPAAAGAQRVDTWDTTVKVQQSGAIAITERIVYDPEDNTHHGIIRDIPSNLVDAQGRHYYSVMDSVSVTDETGRKVPVAESRTGRSGLYLKIGDKDVLLDPGPHTYVINYTITPLVVHRADSDRLTINIVGTSWQTPINRMTARLELPGGARATELECYTGFAGSIEQACLASAAAGTASTTRILNPREAFTLDATLPDLGLAAYSEPDVRPPLSAGEWAIVALLVLGLLGLIAGSGMVVMRMLTDWSQRRSQIIIPRYEAPDGLKPAALSILASPGSDSADTTATLIHLATRGHLKIRQTRPPRWYAKAQYELTRLESADPLISYERGLLTAIFGADQTVKLHELTTRRTAIVTAVGKLRETIGKDLAKKGYFAASPTNSSALVGRIFGFFGAIVLAVIAVGVDYDGHTVAGVMVALAAIAASVLFVWAARHDNSYTPAGHAKWAEVKGFQWFLQVTEKDRLAFTDAPERTPELFSKFLPYATALKVEKQWAKQFAGIDVAQAVGGWYAGSTAFHTLNASDFTNSFASSFASASSSSFAASSGGASAGGGGGGGGGGGW